MIDIHTYNTIEDIADYIATRLEQAVAVKNKISIALSGGNTPKALFEIWVKKYSDKHFWHAISYFWVDERCVEPENIESNFGVANDLFFKPLEIDFNQIFRVKGEQNPIVEADRYQQILHKNISLYNNIPQFDFIFLGIGDDGHTASIFPGNETLFSVDAWCVHTKNPYSNQNRITLTGNVINNAKNVLFIVLGESKQKILREIVLQSDTKKYPAQYVLPSNNCLEILTDVHL